MVNLLERVGFGAVDREEGGKTADVENLLHIRLEGGQGDSAARSFHFFHGEEKGTQTRTADKIKSRAIDDQTLLPLLDDPDQSLLNGRGARRIHFPLKLHHRSVPLFCCVNLYAHP